MIYGDKLNTPGDCSRKVLSTEGTVQQTNFKDIKLEFRDKADDLTIYVKQVINSCHRNISDYADLVQQLKATIEVKDKQIKLLEDKIKKLEGTTNGDTKRKRNKKTVAKV